MSKADTVKKTETQARNVRPKGEDVGVWLLARRKGKACEAQ
jgi:hypothetical protein